ncbi:helix-turn-helix transcriptional regulator [Devosia sp. PTR5]|uniref:Helix-turn-helix transcriptional regulator n=1 Tax=Devosia oryzisoli TaxID=2774138 RepID=A0A927FVA7_9HYPH|nr:LuxR C-terminal-related transcriptional regulator [Devosia oryzisoli]MBD8065997.1 helix-turn-helix transcriptional regulator [Devosia oryzisoli]
MSGSLIATKLFVPKLRAGVIDRGRLNERLQRGGTARLTLVSAPAGFGKTTAVVAWLQSRPPAGAVAWLSLDGTDNQPTVFWAHVIAAFQDAVARVGAPPLDIPEPSEQPDNVVPGAIVNALAALPGSLELVLDDYHVIEQPEVHSGVTFLLEHLPPNIHVVMTTRADPPLPLARLRAQRELVEIRAADLRFTADEITAYLNDVTGLGLSAADVAALGDRTEGWIAALQLAALSMEGREDVAGFIAEFAGTDRYVFDYLVEEVLQRQPETVREFLLETCFLDRLSGPLCDAVTGRSGSRETLDVLYRANLFLVPLDERCEWYRYHHLFADVLETQLDAAARDRLRALRRRASDWYEVRGERTEAVRHALAAEDFERAAELIELAIFGMQRMRQELTIRTWMGTLPDAAVRRRPVLGIGLAGVLASVGEFEGLEERLREVERGFAAITAAGDTMPEGIAVADLAQLPRVPGLVELYRAALSQVRGDMAAGVRHAERVLELASTDDHLARAAAASLLGIAYWSEGKLELARARWTEGRDGLMRAGHVADTLGASIALGDINLALGRLREAAHIFEYALEVSAAQRSPVLRGTADIHTGLALVLREQNDLEAARRHLLASAELGEGARLPQNPYRWRVADALLRQDEGDLDGARAVIETAVRMYAADMFPNVRPVAATRARILVAQGRLDEAARWRRDAGVGPDDAPSFMREYEHITLARLLLAEDLKGGGGTGARALPLLRRLLEAAQVGRRNGSIIELSILLALASRPAGIEEALKHLARALSLAAPEGYVRTFVDEGPSMEALLKAVVKRQIDAEYANRLLAAFGPAQPKPRMHPELIEALSERELDVLRLLGSDLGGPEIARELAISENTMRTHTKNIYEKLGVNSRRAAVSRAEELQLMTRRKA